MVDICGCAKQRAFVECFKDNYLYQHVFEPTHRRPGQREDTLELILTNEEQMINNLEHKAPLGKSQHGCMYFTLSCYGTKKKEIPKVIE